MKGAGIGLIGLLIVAAIIFWIMFGGKEQGGGYVRQELETRERATEQINAIGGKDAEGAPVTESLTYEVDPTRGITIVTLPKGSPFEKKYGLRVGDRVIELGPQPVKGLVSTEKEASDWLTDAFQHSFQIVVDRNGQKLTLPDQRQADVTPGADAAADPTSPPPPAQPKRQSLSGAARDLVNGIPTH